jgi:hypothetical protein
MSEYPNLFGKDDEDDFTVTHLVINGTEYPVDELTSFIRPGNANGNRWTFGFRNNVELECTGDITVVKKILIRKEDKKKK